MPELLVRPKRAIPSNAKRGITTNVLAALALLCAVLMPACSQTRSQAPEKQYRMDGVVLGLDEKAQTANIKHGPIEGWMEAMTMDYPVRSKAEFEQLHVGDHITATVNVRGTDYDLTQIHKQTTPAK